MIDNWSDAGIYIGSFVALCLERTIDPAFALEEDSIKQAILEHRSMDDMAKLLDEIC